MTDSSGGDLHKRATMQYQQLPRQDGKVLTDGETEHGAQHLSNALLHKPRSSRKDPFFKTQESASTVTETRVKS